MPTRRPGSSPAAGWRSRRGPTSAAGGGVPTSGNGSTPTGGALPLSTTHITSGAVLGTGLGRRGGDVRWRVAGSMVLAWVLTLPAAALVAAGIGLIVDGG